MTDATTIDAAAAPRNGVWRLTNDGALVPAGPSSGPATVFVPTEDVLLIVVTLPIASRRQRLAALPFAVEEHIAEPLDSVHVALGDEVSPGLYLAGIVAHGKMGEWASRLAAAYLDHAAIVPDAARLPIPSAGCWSVEASPHRIVVRDASGAGFATPTGRFLALWEAAASPVCVVYGPPLSIHLPLASQTAMPTIDPGARLCELDLRQGRYASRTRIFPKAVRRLVLVLGAGILAQGVIAGAGAYELHRAATERKQADMVLIRQVQPGTSIDSNLDNMVLQNPVRHGRFLAMMARVATALAPVGGLTMSRISFAQRTLTLGVEADDMAGVQRAQTALAVARMAPVSGVATTGEGRANGNIMVLDQGS